MLRFALAGVAMFATAEYTVKSETSDIEFILTKEESDKFKMTYTNDTSPIICAGTKATIAVSTAACGDKFPTDPKSQQNVTDLKQNNTHLNATTLEPTNGDNLFISCNAADADNATAASVDFCGQISNAATAGMAAIVAVMMYLL